MRPAPRPPWQIPVGSAGYTLIEILIALVIVGILASVALPSFMDSIRRGRRSEAVAALAAIQHAQERRRANEPAYSTDLAALGVAATTERGYYTLQIDAADAISYTATATAAGTQASDAACNMLRVRVNRGNIFYGSACTTCTMADPPTDPQRCWSRQ